MLAYCLVVVHIDKLRTSLSDLLASLSDHLNLMRVNLSASVRPLVELNIPWSLLSSNSATHAELTKSISALNQRMCDQLGVIVNAQETATLIIQQSLWHDNSQAPVGHPIITTLSHILFLPLKNGNKQVTASDEARVLTMWLRSWLAEIPQRLEIQCEERIEEAIQSILEDIVVADE